MANSPEFLYKILDSAPPNPLPETLPSTELDRKDNFIHLSTSTQTPITANLFFAHCETLWVLKLHTSKLDGRLEYQEGYPHLHETAKGLGKGNIEDVIEVSRSVSGETDWNNVPGLLELQEDYS